MWRELLGKSTLIKILSARLSPTKAERYSSTASAVSLTPHTALRMGIDTIYQEHIVFNALNITENVFAGSEIFRKGLMQRK